MPSDKQDAEKYRKLLNEGTAANKPSPDAEELRKGTEVEKEHTSDTVIARKIAKDHIVESKGSPLKYYDGLEGLEELMEKLKGDKNPKKKIQQFNELTKEAFMLGYLQKQNGVNVNDAPHRVFEEDCLLRN